MKCVCLKIFKTLNLQSLQLTVVLLCLAVTCIAGQQVCAAEPKVASALNAPGVAGFEQMDSFEAQDTLAFDGVAATSDQAACLAGLAWEPAGFVVTRDQQTWDAADCLFRFPSPVQSRWEINNQVALESYLVRNAAGQIAVRPAVVVVHESGRGMTVGRLFARSFQRMGYHTFLLHLPGYGARNWGERPDPADVLVLLKQGIADVRRARDAVAALPIVTTDQVFLQGTSLGGIVSSTVAGLDNGYSGVFLLLAGGQLKQMILNGQKDAAKLRQQMQQAGVTEAELEQTASAIEPTRLASRIAADRVWLYSGRYDTVVPLANATALANAARLSAPHHILMPVNHYTGIVYFPVVMKHMDQQIQAIVNPTSVNPAD